MDDADRSATGEVEVFSQPGLRRNHSRTRPVHSLFPLDAKLAAGMQWGAFVRRPYLVCCIGAEEPSADYENETDHVDHTSSPTSDWPAPCGGNPKLAMSEPFTTGRKTSRYADLAGKTVFISGGGSGIGAALTRAFAEHGARKFGIRRERRLCLSGATCGTFRRYRRLSKKCAWSWATSACSLTMLGMTSATRWSK